MPHSAIELTKQELNRLPGLVAEKNLSEIKQVVSKVKDSKERQQVVPFLLKLQKKVILPLLKCY